MLKKAWGLFVLNFFFFSCAGPSFKAENKTNQKDFDLKVVKEILPNGLVVLIYENHHLPIFNYTTFVNVGGRHESKGTTGATHFLEHMMFKGAKKYGPGEFDTLIEGVGGSTNAYTTFDNTVYYQSMPSESLATIIDLEADRMQNLLLAPESFEAERQVILEERKMRYENSPGGKLYLAMMQAVFEGTPYGGSVIGDIEDLKALSRDQVMEFFKTFYAPNNAIVVIAGDVDAKKTMALMREKFGTIPPSEHIHEIKKEKDHPELYVHKGRFGREIKLKGDNPTPLFMAAYRGVKIGHEKSYALDLLASILGDGQSAHLYQKFVQSQQRPPLNDVSVASSNLINNGVFYISGQMMEGASLSQFKKNLVSELKRSCDPAAQVITERSLQKTKNNFLISYYQQMHGNSEMAEFLGARESYFGDYSHYKEELAKYEALKVDDLLKVCRDLFMQESPLFLSIGKNTK